jgi:cyclic beta-1,2-glucan synthetase
LIRLLTPPFDRTPHDPGYIKGYLPGVRENGGQYTHAALWAVRALAEAGRAERAASLLEMLSPVVRGGSAEAIATYQAEPYVVAADVYGQPPHTGRAGWTWYTGSAGWMFRVALESVLGVTIQGGRTLVLRPCLPAAWPAFTFRYRLPDGATRYEVVVRRTAGASVVRAPGLAARVEDGAVLVELAGDGAAHRVEVDLGVDVVTRYRPSEAPPERITSA